MQKGGVGLIVEAATEELPLTRTTRREAHMHLFGSYSHNTDAKMRLTLPSIFRKEFDESVVLIKMGFEDCIYGFSPEGFESWVDSLFPEGFNQRNKKHVALRRKLNSSAVRVDIDSAGRIALSKMAERDLEILHGRAVTVIGNNDHFEIWDATTFESADEEISDEEFESLFFDAD